MRRHTIAILLAAASTLPLPVRSEAQQVDVWSRPRQTERVRTWDFLHYRVALDLDLVRQRLQGEATITATPLASATDRIELDTGGLTVEVVGATGIGPLQFDHAAGRLEVTLPGAMAPGDTLRMTVVYHAEGSREGFFFDEEGDGHPAMVSTDSWPDEARQWFPCWDYPNDKATQEMLLTVPAGMKALSNGRLVGVTEDTSGGTITWHWHQERPHASYLAMVAAGPFAVVEDDHGGLPVSYWVYPGTTESSRPVFAKTPEMIGFFEELYGVPFPWAKYAQVTTPHVGGGAEATSATILGQAVLGAASTPERLASWQQVIAHEIAHQWWGDLVTMREWSHTWISESFATYSDYLWTLHDRGPEAGALDLEAKRRRYFTEARERYRRPIVFDRYDRPHDNFDAHTYPKGAAVLHMLRAEMGEEAFLTTLNRFLREHAYRAVTTADFIATAERVADRDLGWFFEQWLFRPGHPELEVAHAWDATTSVLSMRVTQTQDTTGGTPYAYRLPVDIGITTAAGKQVVPILVTGRDQRFTFPLDAAPLLVRFDEGNVLLRELEHTRSEAELRYQAAQDDVVGRRRARERLRAMGITPPPA